MRRSMLSSMSLGSFVSKENTGRQEGRSLQQNAFSAAPENALANVLTGKPLKLSTLFLVAWVRPMFWSFVIEAARPVH